MKSIARISAPVLAFGLVALTLALLIGWYGWKNRQLTKVTPAPETELTDAAPQPAEVEPETLPADLPAEDFAAGLPPVIPISLVPVLVPAENDSWLRDPQYERIPRGLQEFGGVAFELEGLIQLQGRASRDRQKRSYRTAVSLPIALTNRADGLGEIAPPGQNIRSVHLLGASRYEGTPGVAIANVVWRYHDGTSASTPLQYDVHLREWFRETIEQPDRVSYPFSKVVWATPDLKQPQRSLRLYRVTLPNPQPTKTIERLDFVSTMAEPTLFLVGVTLDPLRPGQRPDNSPDLEVGDSVLTQSLALSIRTTEEQPIPFATIRAQFRHKPAAGNPIVYKTLLTDAFGELSLKIAPSELVRLEISASHEDYAPRKMVWDVSSGEVIPATHVFRLAPGIAIGGTIVDPANQPIANVNLSFNRFWMGGEEMNRTGEQFDFPNRTATTDAFGGWQLKGLPAALLDRISFRTSHPDFVETRLTIGSNSGDEAHLRAGTHRLVLRRGLIVRGRVVNAQDEPIADARVWAGRVNHSGTQDTRTDANGTFNFQNLSEGALQFSVLAKGYQPELKNITVSSQMEEIVFRLGPGAVVRGLVQDEAGAPISGVRISLESSSGGVSQEYRFEMTSDAAGRFEWDGAPEETKNFCFLKTGYEAKRGQPLKPNEENVVTLRKGRKVQAWVMDATTDRPITTFRAAVGRHYNFGDSDRFNAEHPGMKNYTDANGFFTIDVNEENVSAIKAEADDYASKVEKLPGAENGVVQVMLRLKPSPALRGVVVNSQGAPVAGASVALSIGNDLGNSVQFRRGQFSASGDSSRVVTTDAEGRFTLGSPPETGGFVVASAESGFGSATVDQVRGSGGVVLQDFGRIEGTIKISGTPAPGQEFMFTLQNLGVSTDWERHRTKSDEQGKFYFDKIPAGEGAIVRLIKMGANSWRHSHNTTVTVAPGETTRVNFGDDGAVIKGQVRLETPPADGEALQFEGSLNTKRPTPPNFATAEETRAFFQSEEWKAQMKQMKNYGVTVNADGSFTADSIPPGEYTLSVTANKPGSDHWRTTPVASGSTTIFIPESASPHVPINLSEIILKSGGQPHIR
jgi:uncharacterized GH25 family protein